MTHPTDIRLPVSGTRMTAEKFFQLPETNEPVQLLNGTILVTPPPIPEHQTTVGDIYVLLRQVVPNGRVFLSPIAVYLDEANVPQPDLVWVAEHSQCRITEKRLEGPPDLVVEVLSTGTARCDKTIKFLLYEQFGVREYWLVDPTRKQIEVWCLEGKALVQHGLYAAGESFESPVLSGEIIQITTVLNL